MDNFGKVVRRLTQAEHAALGISSTKGLYTTQKRGVKKLLKSAVLSKREGDKIRRYQETGVLLTNEQLAQDLAITSGFRTKQDQFRNAREAYIRNIGEVRETLLKSGNTKKTYFIPNKAGELVQIGLKDLTLKKNAEFKRLYEVAYTKNKRANGSLADTPKGRALRQSPKERAKSKRRLAALYKLTGEDQHLSYLEGYNG